MDGLIQELAQARQEETKAKLDLVELEAEIEQEYGGYLKEAHFHLDTARAAVKAAEDAARGVAILAYEQDGAKHPHPAVQIKVFTTVDYEAKDALAYCITHLPAALKVDKRKFEAVAKVAELEFVTIGEEPRAYISRDLSEYVGEEDES